jgi:hypothetical protein
MSKRAVILLALGALLLLSGYSNGFGAHERSDFDRRFEVGPGGAIEADIVLGGGISFDHGSLQVRSHGDDQVRVEADSSGWGKYAVDIDVQQQGNRITLVGRVEGPLHWMFGGPEVDVTIWVPRDFDVTASIDGGPLLLEDLTGPIRAHVHDAKAILRRAEGPVVLRLQDASVEVEDVDGELEIEARGGHIEIVGLRGSLEVRATGGGFLVVDNVIGPVRIESEHHRVAVEDVEGDVEVRTQHGRIDVEEVTGDLTVKTQHGGITLEEIDGRVVAASRRGSIQVDFTGTPSGEIETESGRIEIHVPDQAGFVLDARTGRGRIRMDDFEGLRPIEPGARAEQHDSGTSAELAERRRELEARNAWNESWGGDGTADHGRTPSEILASINGGGPTLRLRTGRGSIRIQD